MAVTVAGLFDSEADVTRAMDRLHREGLEGLETRVINGSARQTGANPGLIIPIIPTTSGGMSGQGTLGAAAAGMQSADWLGDMDDVERKFYEEALRDGSTLALARVKDEDASRVRLLFTMFNASTYSRD